jgi:hypothetical protein
MPPPTDARTDDHLAEAETATPLQAAPAPKPATPRVPSEPVANGATGTNGALKKRGVNGATATIETVIVETVIVETVVVETKTDETATEMTATGMTVHRARGAAEANEKSPANPLVRDAKTPLHPRKSPPVSGLASEALKNPTRTIGNPTSRILNGRCPPNPRSSIRTTLNQMRIAKRSMRLRGKASRDVAVVVEDAVANRSRENVHRAIEVTESVLNATTAKKMWPRMMRHPPFATPRFHLGRRRSEYSSQPTWKIIRSRKVRTAETLEAAADVSRTAIESQC